MECCDEDIVDWDLDTIGDHVCESFDDVALLLPFYQCASLK
jgi:hypothetical protein